MSFWDNVKKFTQPYADDDYDEYEDDDGSVGYETDHSEPAPRYTTQDTEPAEEKKPFDFSMDTNVSSAPVSSGFNGSVVNVGNTGNKQQVVLFHPNNFNDTSKAADDLRSKKAVIINMEGIDKAMARRVVDFMSGCAYSLDGTVKKIASCTYLFCPYNMDIVGDLENLQSEFENYV